MRRNETSDDYDRGCPYCGNKYRVEGEDVSEDIREEECCECGKKYHAYDSISVTHHAVPDCELNGERHEWPLPDGHQICMKCSKWRGVADATK